jgi:hypothetical protein
MSVVGFSLHDLGLNQRPSETAASLRADAEAVVLSHFGALKESPSPAGWLRKSSLTVSSNDRLMATPILVQLTG